MNKNTSKPRILAVVGSTASGKTALAVELARQLGGEIVSCDSMQIYRGMNIGTAKPDDTERRGIPHHLMDIVSPTDPDGYSCADYVRDARAAVEDVLALAARPDVDVTYVSGEQIAEGALDHADALLVPGGRRDKMWKAARPLVEKFAAGGHRVVQAGSEL